MSKRDAVRRPESDVHPPLSNRPRPSGDPTSAQTRTHKPTRARSLRPASPTGMRTTQSIRWVSGIESSGASLTVSRASTRRRRAKVLLLGGARLHRDIIRRTLDSHGAFDVVASLARLDADAHAQLERVQPDLCLIDVSGPTSCANLRAMRQRYPRAHLVAIGVPDSVESVGSCVEGGAVGFLTREMAMVEFLAALERAGRGELVCHPDVVALLLRSVSLSQTTEQLPSCDLTPRERDVADLLRLGRSNKEIAAKLVIELATVKTHVHNILTKLNASRRSEAAVLLSRNLPADTSASRDRLS